MGSGTRKKKEWKVVQLASVAFNNVLPLLQCCNSSIRELNISHSDGSDSSQEGLNQEAVAFPSLETINVSLASARLINTLSKFNFHEIKHLKILRASFSLQAILDLLPSLSPSLESLSLGDLG